MVPEGWNVLPLGEMAEFRNGLNFAKDDEGQEIKVVTIPDFWQRTVLRDFSKVKTIQCRGKVPVSSFLVSGDLLFVRSNGNPELVGRCLFFPQVSEPISFSGFTIRGRMNQARILPEFAASVMVTDRTKDQFRRGRGGGNISNLSQDILAGVQVALPPLPEQRKIAEILSTWDRAIEVSEALLATARTQKRALMQALLTGKRRFPEFEGEEWKEVQLGDGMELQSGYAFKSREFVEQGVPIVRIGNIEREVTLKGSPSYQLQNELSRFLIDDRDMLISMTGYVGKVGKFRSTPQHPHAYLNQRVGRIKISEHGPIHKEFLWQLLDTPYFKREVEGAAAGGAQPNVSSKDICSVKFDIPSIVEQVRIASILSVNDREISILRSDIQHLRTERKALMQQLLTGKRRVTV